MLETDILRIALTHPQPHRSDPSAFAGQPQSYIAQGLNGGYGEAVFPWPEALEHLESLTDVSRNSVERQLGELLRRFLTEALQQLHGWERIERELKDAEERQQPLRVAFGFDAIELFSLPWPLLRLRDQRTLGAHPYCHLQFEWLGEDASAPAPGTWERVLFAWSDAVRPVAEDRHREALRQAYPSFEPGRDELPGVTPIVLKKALHAATQAGTPVQILHILCHGEEREDGTYGLQWSDLPSRGGIFHVTGDEMVRLLDPYKHSLKLVVLGACHGAHPGRMGKLVGGVAHDLHRAGIPYVIASQLPLSIEGAALMTEALYKHLLKEKTSVETAFKAAQTAVTHLFRDWASLQLFCSSHAFSESRRRDLRRSRRVLFSSDGTLPELVSGDLAVTYEVNLQIPITPVLKALASTVQQEPDIAVLKPLGQVEDALPKNPPQWKRTFAEADHFVRALMAKETLKRQPVLHLFGGAPLPLMFHLGWRLGRHPLRVYQQQRGRGDTWTCGYDSDQAPPADGRFLRSDSWPTAEECRKAGGRIAVTVEVSRRISEAVLGEWLGKRMSPALVRLFPPGEPSHTAVRNSGDVAQAVLEFQNCLDRIHDTLPEVKEVWLALTCPSSLAAALGRVFNPKAQAPLHLYNFRTLEGYVCVYSTAEVGRARKPRR